MRVLLLGGTTEASALADRLADDSRFTAILSLAGVTRSPVLPRIAHRIGGFGGIDFAVGAGNGHYRRARQLRGAGLRHDIHPRNSARQIPA